MASAKCDSSRHVPPPVDRNGAVCARSRRRNRNGGVLAAILLVSACGGSDFHWHPTRSDQDFLDEVFTTIQPCCARHGLDPSGRNDEWKTIMLGEGFSRDEALRSACLAELRQLATASECVPAVLDNADDPCARVFAEPSGSQAVGASCSVRADCAGAPHDITVCSSNGPDVCASLAPGDVGSSPCVPPPAPDADVPTHAFICPASAGLFCDGSTHACAALLGAGEPCSSPDACMSGTCLTSDNTCAPIGAVGASCVAAACDQGSRCEPKTMTCVARLPDGARCTGAIDECIGNCDATDLTCHPETQAFQIALSSWCD